MSVGLAILAAGGSSRMGQPKQLLPFENSTLIEHVITAAMNSQCDPVVLVLGAHSDRIVDAIQLPAKMHTVVNDNWQEGLASSLRLGLHSLLKLDDCLEGIMIALCDQPFVSAEIFDALLRAFHQSGKLVVGSRYSHTTVGPPALFHRNLFDELLELSGDKGARLIVEKYRDQVDTLEFSLGSIDLDTLDDYLALSAPGSSTS